jgi:hypothetical protein
VLARVVGREEGEHHPPAERGHVHDGAAPGLAHRGHHRADEIDRLEDVDAVELLDGVGRLVLHRHELQRTGVVDEHVGRSVSGEHPLGEHSPDPRSAKSIASSRTSPGHWTPAIFATSRTVPMTVHPSRAKRSANARPMPVDTPVMRMSDTAEPPYIRGVHR